MTAIRDESLLGLRKWLLSRIWPKRYPTLESSFLNFRLVLDDLHELFRSRAQAVHYSSGAVLITAKFYEITEWDPPRYHKLLQEYNFHVDLIGDLVLELTRAANYVSDRVREYLFPGFRLEEGVILVDSGPYMDLKYISHRVEYREGERVDVPYPGLDDFKAKRATRDYHFGVGPTTTRSGSPVAGCSAADGYWQAWLDRRAADQPPLTSSNVGHGLIW